MQSGVKIYVLPGGRLPVRQTDGAIGFDASLRAIVCPKEMDPSNPNLRKMLFDFENIPTDPEIARHVVRDERGELVYRMDPEQSVLGGIGFVTEMPFPMFYWLAPRSGLASRGITIDNAPGTVDPDYRGEAGALVHNRNKTTFDLQRNMRIVQIIFQIAHIPNITEANDYRDLNETRRGAGGFGSTGIK